METTLHDFRDDFAIPYLDDVIIFSKSFDDYVEHSRRILCKFKEKGLKLKLSKCSFFQHEVKYLGRRVNKDGYRMDTESIEAVQALKEKIPATTAEVRKLLGLVGYHRNSVQDFARIAKPLTDLLVGHQSSREPVQWLDEHQQALNTLIDLVTNQPILVYPDYKEEFYIHTDASSHGLGCILYQRQEGKIGVISFASRTFRAAEKNYHSTKLEFLALKWGICEKFPDYLRCADHFTVFIARERVYWPRMYSDIEHYTHNQCKCIISKHPPRNVLAPLQSIYRVLQSIFTNGSGIYRLLTP